MKKGSLANMAEQHWYCTVLQVIFLEYQSCCSLYYIPVCFCSESPIFCLPTDLPTAPHAANIDSDPEDRKTGRARGRDLVLARSGEE